MLKTKLKFHIKLVIAVILTLGLSISLQSILAQWQAPTAGPPGGNIKTPINTGIITQDKSGSLGVGGDLTVLGNIYGDKLTINSPWRGIKMIDSGPGGHRYDFIVGAISSNPGRFGIYDDTASAYRFNIDSNGNVGIGTTNPNANLKLDVEGRIGATEYCDEDGNNCVDASTGLGGGGTGQIECATVRRYENNSTATSLVDYTTGFTAPLSEIYIDDDTTPSTIPSWAANDNFYGFQCNESNDWIITGCAHAQSGGSGDSDVFMDNNGCYAGRNDGDQNRNSLDMRCCRVVGGGGGASIDTGNCQNLSTGIDTNTWTDCPAGYVITGFMAGYGHSSDYNQDHKIRCCKLQ